MEGGLKARGARSAARSASLALEQADALSCVPGPVLVAIDLSLQSSAALLWACRHAEKFGAQVIVLHVLYDPPEAPGKYNRRKGKNIVPMVDAASEMLAEFMAAARRQHPDIMPLSVAQELVVRGLPPSTIIEQATKCQASLIVVASRAEGLLPRLMHGSTAQQLVRLSSIPITVIKD